MALKDAGITRARFGDVELEFAPSVEDAVASPAEPIVITLPKAPQISDANGVPSRPGYSQLFGKNTPRFTPAEEK